MNINELVREELKLFIFETHGFNDSDTIDISRINLQHEYDKLNNLLFNGSLPKVPLKWSTRKNSLGHVHGQYNRYSGEIKIVHLAISKFYATTYLIFKNTLAHEMIHVKQLSSGERGNHGYSFTSEANRINSMGLGFNITQTSDEMLNVSSDIQNKRQLIAFILKFNDKYFVSVTTPQTFELDGEKFFRILQYTVNSGKYNSVEVIIVASTNNNLLKFKIGRSFKNGFSYSPLSDDLLQELLKDKIIKTVKFTQGQPADISENNETQNGEWVDFTIS